MQWSEIARADTRRELRDERKEAVVLADRGVAPAQLRKLRELLSSFEIAGQRLFADDVLADAKGFAHERRVQNVSCRDVHGIDGRSADLRERGPRSRTAQL